GEGRCDPGPGDLGVEAFQGDPPGCRHGGGGSEGERAEEGSTDQQGDDTLGVEPEPAIRPVAPDLAIWPRGGGGPAGTHGRKVPRGEGRGARCPVGERPSGTPTASDVAIAGQGGGALNPRRRCCERARPLTGPPYRSASSGGGVRQHDGSGQVD